VASSRTRTGIGENATPLEGPSDEAVEFTVPLLIRGEAIIDNLVSFGGRHGEATFRTPDVRFYLDRIPLRSPSGLQDLYDISLDEIIDFLARLGRTLSLDNPHIREAFALSCRTSGLTPKILRRVYEVDLPAAFEPEALRAMVEHEVGSEYLEGWVESGRADGRTVAIRAFGARALHITPGNLPTAAAVTLIRNALTRSDAIVKSPSNDPLTATALVRAMMDLNPAHPITRHVVVGYWKGGDEAIESMLYVPRNVEKIVAWGGFASVKHVTRYLQPGIELITLDPKLSSTIVGAEAFVDEEAMREVAVRIAADIGLFNQEACVNARVIYVQSGTDEEGLGRLNRLGGYVYEALLKLPESGSSVSASFDRELRAEIEAIRFETEHYRVIGAVHNEGGVIVSQFDEPVDFSRLLSGRVGNLVPIDHLERAIGSVNSYTQTIGVYPESLKNQIRDRLSQQGAQRIVSLGYATSFTVGSPQDAIEPMRRLCKWIVDEGCDGRGVTKPWL
jgi:hypothetical protein